MEYEVVTLEEKIAVGICARTSNTAPDMGAVIGGLSMGLGTEESIRLANRVAAAVVSVQGPVMNKEMFDKKMEEYHE